MARFLCIASARYERLATGISGQAVLPQYRDSLLFTSRSGEFATKRAGGTNPIGWCPLSARLTRRACRRGAPMGSMYTSEECRMPKMAVTAAFGLA